MKFEANSQKLSPEQKSKIRAKLNSYQTNPTLFFKEILGNANHWDKQIEVANSVAKNRRTTVKSGHATGKSYNDADIALWFLYCFPNSIVLTTAPTWRQVEKVIWGEIASHWHAAKVTLGGRLLETEIKLGPKWYAMGFSSDTRDAFQGFHADHILIIVDEPSGVEDETSEQIESLMANEHARLLYNGNPIRRLGFFFDSFSSDSFNHITISCLDSPNVKKGKVIIPGLVTKQWVEERKAEWGEDSSIYQSRVLGEFPMEEEDVLIPLAWVYDSNLRWVKNTGKKLDGQIKIGLDVARFGKNKTVFIVRHGRRVLEIISYKGFDLMHTVDVACRLIKQYDPDDLIIDDNGVGGGVTDRLRQMKREKLINFKKVTPVTAGEEAQDKKKFQNRKSELGWRVREAYQRLELDVPEHERLMFECSHQYYDTTTEDSKIRIMSKSMLRRKKIESPDFFDSLSLTYADELPYSLKQDIKQYTREFWDMVHVQKIDPNALVHGTSRFLYLVPNLNGPTVLLWCAADRNGLMYFYRERVLERATSTTICQEIAECESLDPTPVEVRYTPRLFNTPDEKNSRYHLLEQLEDKDYYFEEFEINLDIAGFNLREGLAFNPDRALGPFNHPHVYFSPECPTAIRSVKQYMDGKMIPNEPLYEMMHRAVALAVLTEPVWLKIHNTIYA